MVYPKKDFIAIQNLVYGTDYSTLITDPDTLRKAVDRYLDTNIQILSKQISILSEAAKAQPFFEAWEAALHACQNLILLEHKEAIFRHFCIALYLPYPNS
ncbi:MAG: hypothetical protein SOT28_11295 [Fusicatenibacter sp.]|nr:hypothetical protein [Lachnospiraceae bacterium]MDY2938871.1 hypothetical protein [Fusicatenibacter sp.]